MILVFLVVMGKITLLGFEAYKSEQRALRVTTTSSIKNKIVENNKPKNNERIEILDRNGWILALNLKMASLYVDTRKLIDKADAVDKIISVFNDLDRNRLSSKFDKFKGYTRIKQGVSPRQHKALLNYGIPGLEFIPETKRIYPNQNIASHILGYVDSGNLGIYGIEKYIDDTNKIAQEKYNTSFFKNEIKLSIDLRAQHVLHEELEYAIEKYKAKAAAALIMDVNTGEVIAMTSLPDFNPHEPAKSLEEDYINRVTKGVYELGSVFKLFTIAMALDSGQFSIKDIIDASKPIKIAKKEINDFHGLKRPMSVEEVFIHSSNIGAAKITEKLGIKHQKEFLDKLSLTRRLDIELTENAKPLLPKNWRMINAMTISYGHGLSITPLHALSATSALVNGGYLVNPTFIKRNTNTEQHFRTKVLKDETSVMMRYLMRLNVLEGTAKKADVEGYSVGAKTGTAEKIGKKGYDKDKLLNSFIATFPTYNPKYSVLVMLEEPQAIEETHGHKTSGWNAAPITAKIINRIAPILTLAPDALKEDTLDSDILANYMIGSDEEKAAN